MGTYIKKEPETGEIHLTKEEFETLDSILYRLGDDAELHFSKTIKVP